MWWPVKHCVDTQIHYPCPFPEASREEDGGGGEWRYRLLSSFHFKFKRIPYFLSIIFLGPLLTNLGPPGLYPLWFPSPLVGSVPSPSHLPSHLPLTTSPSPPSPCLQLFGESVTMIRYPLTSGCTYIINAWYDILCLRDISHAEQYWNRSLLPIDNI